jgi:PAS domain S-box-containing protein
MVPDDIDALREELERARHRIAELETRLVAEIESNKAPSWLFATLDMADIGVWDWDITLDTVSWTASVYRSYGETPDSFGGNLNAVVEATLEEDRGHLGKKIEHTMTTGEPYSIEYRIRRPDGSIRWISAWGQASFDGQGKPIRLAGTAIDVTDRKREDAEKLEMHQRVIDAQRDALRALGTPVIPLAHQTLATPLVGELTHERIAQLTEVLLNAVRDTSAQVVLLDLTGVSSIDTVAAEGLIKTGHAARLLGTQIVFTGVRPHVAKTLVDLGVDLGTFVLKANLQSGIEYATKLGRTGSQ